VISINVFNEFLENATLHNFAAGSYVDGEWVDGAETNTAIRASIQPLSAGDYRLLPEGNSGQRGWKVYWNGNFELGVANSLRPDEMTIEGIRHKLVHKEEWQKHGYSAGSFIEIK